MTLRILNFSDGFSSGMEPDQVLGKYVVYDPEEIDAGGIITSSTGAGFQRRAVFGDGAVTTLNTPFGTGGEWVDGLVITLLGTSDTNTVTLTFNDAQYGAILNGDITLSKGVSITLQYNETDERWYEIGRNN
jgi:hypothetical protein